MSTQFTNITINHDYLAMIKSRKDGRRARRNEERAKVGDVRTLQARHYQVIRMHVDGMKNVDIAEQLGITPMSVSQIINSDLSREHIAKLTAAADKTAVVSHLEFQAAAVEANKYLRGIIRGEEEAPVNTRVQVCQNYLDRAGYAPIAKSQVAVAHGHFDPDDLKALKERAERAKREQLAIPVNVVPIKSMSEANELKQANNAVGANSGE
jgi:DNA-binding CsgD family transcriptional regulator